jgi:DNA-directed RNA polymerase subunit F
MSIDFLNGYWVEFNKYFGVFNTSVDDPSYVRQDLRAMMKRYCRIKDCLKGQDAVKAKRIAYLPQPNRADLSQENQYRYEMYLERAVFYPVLQQTSLGLIGQCFLYDPILNVPEELKSMMDNVDGVSDIYQFARKVLATNVNYSRGGIFTDYPTTQEEMSLADSEKTNPSMFCYEPENIINWKTKEVNGKDILSMVVLYECEDSGAKTFAEDYEENYRVLMLDENNLYKVEVWKKDSKSKNKLVLEETIEPTIGGERIPFIPFIFLGAETNSPNICDPQMDSIACLNIAHFRNSADYEDSSYWVGQPTPVFTGLTESWVKKVLNGIVRFGSLGSISLPVGGDAKLLQALPNSMPIEGMKHKEDQMLSLGAKIIQPNNIIKTATESTMDKSDENSILTCTSKNASVAIKQSLKWAYMYKVGKMDSPKLKEINFELRTESALMNMTSNEAMQRVADWQAGVISYKELRTVYSKAGIAYEDIKEPLPLPKTQESMKQQEAMKGSGTVNPSTGKDFAGNKNNN